MRTLCIKLLTAVAIFIPLTISAQNKVVVIPLFGEEEPTSKIAFVTQGTWQGDMGGGILGGGHRRADLHCRNEANSLPGSLVKGKTFKAWVARSLPTDYSSGSQGSSSFNRYELPYKLVDGATLATGFRELVSSTTRLLTPLQLGANGMPTNASRVWTGILQDGTFASPNCNNWTSSSPVEVGRVGAWPHTLLWSDFSPNDMYSPCSSSQALYCFEQ